MAKKREMEIIREFFSGKLLDLCQNNFSYQHRLAVEGLLAITLDNEDIVVVNVNKRHYKSASPGSTTVAVSDQVPHKRKLPIHTSTDDSGKRQRVSSFRLQPFLVPPIHVGVSRPSQASSDYSEPVGTFRLCSDGSYVGAAIHTPVSAESELGSVVQTSGNGITPHVSTSTESATQTVSTESSLHTNCATQLSAVLARQVELLAAMQAALTVTQQRQISSDHASTEKTVESANVSRAEDEEPQVITIEPIAKTEGDGEQYDVQRIEMTEGNRTEDVISGHACGCRPCSSCGAMVRSLNSTEVSADNAPEAARDNTLNDSRDNTLKDSRDISHASVTQVSTDIATELVDVSPNNAADGPHDNTADVSCEPASERTVTEGDGEPYTAEDIHLPSESEHTTITPERTMNEGDGEPYTAEDAHLPSESDHTTITPDLQPLPISAILDELTQVCSDSEPQVAPSHELLDKIVQDIEQLLEKENDVKCRLTEQTGSLRQLEQRVVDMVATLDSAPSTTGAQSSIIGTVRLSPGTSQAEDDEDPVDDERVIRQMASSNPQVRAKTNFLQCLDALGFPVNTSLKDLKQANAQLAGDTSDAKRKRKALTNSLIDLIPPNKSEMHSIRNCLYGIAPPTLWQFFSSQGKSGSKKTSLLNEMPHIYNAVIRAAASRCGVDKSSLVSALSYVLRMCGNRSDSKQYRSEISRLDDSTATSVEGDLQSAIPELQTMEIESHATERVVQDSIALISRGEDADTLKKIHRNNKELMEIKNDVISCLSEQSSSISTLDQKLNDLSTRLSAAPAAAGATHLTPRVEAPPDGDEGKTVIHTMSSSDPKVRAKTNYLQCFDALGFPVISSLKHVKEQHEELLRLRRLVDAASTDDFEEDLLPVPLTSLAKLRQMSDKLRKDSTAFKHMVRCLRTCGGHDAGHMTRRVLAKVGTSELWSHFSLHGRKGKLSFASYTICRAIIEAVRKTQKQPSDIVEKAIGETLKYAPKKAQCEKSKRRSEGSVERSDDVDDRENDDIVD